ncbi:oocyte zinc finger protein XlCOF6.1-like isoform X3 [Cheilinus undulatus]|uniref:oocyte zinc finger protein XlCOF6.1-like isoform X3 n=1 Tax=Cheilinus undulatus TaxID=241271 RepID=UPI001BD4D965|nr:oocyte zinc finger protein XlCOF6.1-like isoform X3 [Cheilinus undulatus]
MSTCQDLSEVPQLSLPKKEVLPEQQERRSSLNQEITRPLRIKEEPEELWRNQEEEHLQGPEEDDIIKFTFDPLLVKNEDSEENPQSPECLQQNTEEMETEADREDCEASEAVGCFQPETEYSSEVETDDSADWTKTTEHQSGLNSVKNIKRTRRKSDKKSHCCSVCGKTFSLRGHFTVHMRNHSGEKPYSCSVCGKRFSQKCSLPSHMRIHTGEKPFCCSECGKKFNKKSNLKSHMASHRGEKPFSCSDCGKKFTFRTNMIKHKIIHTGEKPFSCSECGKSYKYKSSLTSHTAQHRGEKLFSCSECGKKFAWSSQVARHKCVGGQAEELLQNQAEEKKDKETGADREDCKGSEAAKYFHPGRDFHLEIQVKTEDLSEAETGDSADWTKRQQNTSQV